METSYIITFIGDDKPGLVEQVAKVVEASGGSWQESRLSQLGGKFAGLVLVALPEKSAAQLQTDLKALSASGLSIRVTPKGSTASEAPTRTIHLAVIGPDRQGIVREISQALAAHHVNVVDMESEVSSAPMSAEMLFEARIDAQISSSTELDDLSDTLDEIANQMTLDIILEPS